VKPAVDLSQLTVVIPTVSRPLFVIRQFEYWRDLNAQVVILDGASAPISIPQALKSNNIRYVHTGTSLNHRLSSAQEYIQTKYCIWLPDDEFSGRQTLYKNFFKTPLAVNNCVETMVGPMRLNEEDYGALVVLAELMTFTYLLPSIREKGGAYGAGCGIDESGIISFYSYRDPNVSRTFENFEKAI